MLNFLLLAFTAFIYYILVIIVHVFASLVNSLGNGSSEVTAPVGLVIGGIVLVLVFFTFGFLFVLIKPKNKNIIIIVEIVLLVILGAVLLLNNAGEDTSSVLLFILPTAIMLISLIVTLCMKRVDANSGEFNTISDKIMTENNNRNNNNQ